jgi:hypothetical protein
MKAKAISILIALAFLVWWGGWAFLRCRFILAHLDQGYQSYDAWSFGGYMALIGLIITGGILAAGWWWDKD